MSDWLQLIKEAKDLGISKEEVYAFLHKEDTK